MNLLEAISTDGTIILQPSGKHNEQPLRGEVDKDWFFANHTDLANASVPLSEKMFDALQQIDEFWRENAIRWRGEGLI